MAVSAVFPSSNRQTVRAQVNEMDKSTVVSIFPKKIHEVKHTIQPGVFNIAAGSLLSPAILVVGSSSWWREFDENQPMLEIPHSSVQIADSIVRDYLNGMIGCNMADCKPGVFFLQGDVSLSEVLKSQSSRLNTENENQKRWYQKIVQMSDAMWARTNGNPLAISDDARMAARELGLNTKEWLQDFQQYEMVKCVACGNMRNPGYPVCPNCKSVIDPTLATKLGIKQVASV